MFVERSPNPNPAGSGFESLAAHKPQVDPASPEAGHPAGTLYGHDSQRRAEPRIVQVRPAGEDHQVLSIEGGGGHYRRRPCGAEASTPDRPGCPWRVDAVGHFPPEAFAQSARTAEDLSGHMFGCHESGSDRPVTCAGFLLRGADHNMAVRMRSGRGRIDYSQLDDGGYELHAGYTTMAVANGLDIDDPALRNVRWSYHEEAQSRGEEWS